MKETGDILGGGSEAAVVIAPQPGDSVVLPDAAYLAAADFARLGSDLVLQAEGQPTLLLQGYFEPGGARALLSPEGAKIGPELAAKLAGPLAPGQVAQASAAPATEMIGEVTELTGSARVTRTNGVEEDLSLGDPVYLGDVLATGADSSVGITFVDDTLFSLGADARLVLNTLIFDPGGDSNSLAVSIVTGAFTLISGQIAGSDGPGITVETPVATIGVRGTALSGIYQAIEHTLTTTLLEFAGEVGAYEVFNAVSLQSLVNALATVVVSSQTESIGTPSQATPEQLALYRVAIASATNMFLQRLQELDPEAGDQDDGQGNDGGSINDPQPFDVEDIGQNFDEADEGIIDPGFNVTLTLGELLDLFGLDPNLLLLLGLGLPQGATIIVSLARGLESVSDGGGGGGFEGNQIPIGPDLEDVGGEVSLTLLNIPPEVTVLSESTGLFFFNDTEELGRIPLGLADLEDLAVIPPAFADADFTLVLQVTVNDPVTGTPVLTIGAIFVNVQAFSDLAKLIYTAATAEPLGPLELIAELQDVAGLNRIQTEFEGQGRVGVNETFDTETGTFANAQDLGALDAAESGRALTVNGWAGDDPDANPLDGTPPVPDVDVYKVTLTAGTYQVDLDFASQDESDDPDSQGRIDAFDAYMAVYDAAGNRLDESNPTTEGEDPFITVTVATPGMYFVVVTPSVNLPASASFLDGFVDNSTGDDDLVGDYQLQIRGDEAPILPGERFHQTEIEDNAAESSADSGMYEDAANLIKETGFKFQVGEQVEVAPDGVIVGPDGSESITRAQINVVPTNEGESFTDIPGFMIDFGAGSGFVEPGDGTADIRVRLFGQSAFEVVQAGLSYDATRGIFVLTFPETLRVQEVDLMEIDWKVEQHDDHDFDLEVIVRTTETHPNEPIAVIVDIDGVPTATRTTNDGEIQENLALSDQLFLLDSITTGPGESLTIRFTDQSLFEIGPNQTLLLDTSVFDPLLGADTAGFEGNPNQVAIPHNHQSATLSVETRAVADKPLVELTHVCVIEDEMEGGAPVPFDEGEHGPQDGSEGPLTVTSTLSTATVDRDGTESIHKIVLSTSDVDLFSPDLALADFMLFIDGEMINVADLVSEPQVITLNGLATVFRNGAEVSGETLQAEVALVGTTLEITFPDNNETGEESILSLTFDIDLKYPRHEAEDFTLHAEVTTKELNPFGEVEVLTQSESTSERIEVKEIADAPEVELTHVCVIEDIGTPFDQQGGEYAEQTSNDGPLTVSSTLTTGTVDRDGSESLKTIVLSVSSVDLSSPDLALGGFTLKIDDEEIRFDQPFPQTITLNDVTLFEDGAEVPGTIEASVALVGEMLEITFPSLGAVDSPDPGTLSAADDALLDVTTVIELSYPQHEAEDFDLTATVTTIELNPDGDVAVSEATNSDSKSIEIKEVADKPTVELTHVCVIEDIGTPFVVGGEYAEQTSSDGPLTVSSTLTTGTVDRDGSESLKKIVLSVSSVDLSSPDLALGGFTLKIDDEQIRFDQPFPQTITLNDVTLFEDGAEVPGAIEASVALVGETLEITFPSLGAVDSPDPGTLSAADDALLDVRTVIELSYPQHEAEDFDLTATVTTIELNPDGDVALSEALHADTKSIEIKEVADKPTVELTHVCVIEDIGTPFDSEGGEYAEQTSSDGPLTVSSTLTTKTIDRDGSESLKKIVLSVSEVDLSSPDLALGGFTLKIDDEEIRFDQPFPQTITLNDVTLFEDGGEVPGSIEASVALVGETLEITFPSLGTVDSPDPGTLSAADDALLDVTTVIELSYPQHEAEDFDLTATVTTIELNPDGDVALSEATHSDTKAIEIKEVADEAMVELSEVTVVEEDEVPLVPSGPQPASPPQLMVSTTLSTGTIDRDGSESLAKIVLSVSNVDLSSPDLALEVFDLMIEGVTVDFATLLTGDTQAITFAGVTLFVDGAEVSGSIIGELALNLAEEKLEVSFPSLGTVDNPDPGTLSFEDDALLDLTTELKLTYPLHEAENFDLTATVTTIELNPDGEVAVSEATASDTRAIIVEEVADAPTVSLSPVAAVDEDTVPLVPSGPQPATTDGAMVATTLTTGTVDRDGSESLKTIVLSVSEVDLSSPDLALSGFSLMIEGETVNFAALLGGGTQTITFADVILFVDGAEVAGSIVGELSLNLAEETLEISFPSLGTVVDPDPGTLSFEDDALLDLTTELKLTYPLHEAEDFDLTATVTTIELNPDGDVAVSEATKAATTPVVVKEVADVPTVSLSAVAAVDEDALPLVPSGPQPATTSGAVVATTLTTGTIDRDGSESLKKIVLSVSNVDLSSPYLALGGFTLKIDEEQIRFDQPFPQTITLNDVTLFEDGAEVPGTIEASVALVGETLEITFPSLGTVDNPDAGTLSAADDALLDVTTVIELTYPLHEAEDFDLTATVTTIELNPDGTVALSEATNADTKSIAVKEVADAPLVSLTDVCVVEDTGLASASGQQDGTEGDPAPLMVTSTLKASLQDQDGSEGLTEVRLSVSNVDPSLPLTGFVLTIDGKAVGFDPLPSTLTGLKVTLVDGTTATVSAAVSLDETGSAPVLVLRFADNAELGDTGILTLGDPAAPPVAGGPEGTGWDVKLTYPQHEAEDFTLHAEIEVTEINPDDPSVAPAVATATDVAQALIAVKEVADAPDVEVPGLVYLLCEDFSSNSLGLNLAAIEGTPDTSGGNVDFAAETYVGTNEDNFHNVSFVAEITVHFPTPSTNPLLLNAAFFGLGPGTTDEPPPPLGDNYGNPANGPVVFLRHFDPFELASSGPSHNSLAVTTNDEDNFGLTPGSPAGMGEISNVGDVGPGTGPYRLKMAYDATTKMVQFSVDDVPYGPGLVDVSGYNFTDQARIFFGGTDVVFDDLKIEATGPVDGATPTLIYCEDNADDVDGVFADVSQVFVLPIDASVVDRDGSEGISQIKLTLSGLIVDQSGVPDEFIDWMHGSTVLGEGVNNGFTIGGFAATITVAGTMLTIDFADAEARQDIDVTEIGVKLAEHYSGSFTVDHMVTSKEIAPDGTPAVLEATSSGSYSVLVEGVADEASLSATNVTVAEDEKVTLLIAAALDDLDGSETMVVTVTGIPADWTLVGSNGTLTADTWVSGPLGPGAFENPMFMPPADFNTGTGSLDLNVSVTTTEGDPVKAGAETATLDQDFTITVTPVNDAPSAAPVTDSTTEDSGTYMLDTTSFATSGVVSDVDLADVLAITGVTQDVDASGRDIAGSFSFSGGMLSFETALFNNLSEGTSEDIVFIYTVDDQSSPTNATNTNTITVTVDGVDDAPTITGSSGGTFDVDATDKTVSGKLEIDDPDTGESSFQQQTGLTGSGGFGTLNINSDGSWTFFGDEGESPSGTVTDDFTVTTADGTDHVISIGFGAGGEIDPIYFDLGEPGVGFTSASDGVAFDLDADGAAERLAWSVGEDGLLVLDRDGSGAIEDGREVFSPDFGDGGFTDALDALASLDDNGDGLLNAEDAAFEDLQLWIDGNADGVTQEGELVGLYEQGIVEIDLATTAVDLEIDGQEVYAEGVYSLESGEARPFIAVNLDKATGGGPSAAVETTAAASVLPAILRSGDSLAAQQAPVADIGDVAALRRAGQFVQRGDFVAGAYALVPLVAGGETDWASIGLQGAIDEAEDVDVFAFLAHQGETLRIDALSTAPGTRIEIRGSDGALLATDDAVGGAADVPGEGAVAARSASAAAQADGLAFVVVHAPGSGAVEAGGDYLLTLSIALDGENDAAFSPLEPGQSVSTIMIDADQYLALGEPIPLELLFATADQDGSARLYELEISGLREGGSLSYLDADGALVTLVDGEAADGDGLVDGRITLDLTQYQDSALAGGPGGLLTSLETGEAGIDLRLNEDAIDDSDMALMIKAVSQDLDGGDPSPFVEELVTVDVVIAGVSGILVDETGENVLSGGAGGDLLLGGQGADALTGGAGSDTFIYRPGDGGTSIAGADSILDFQDAIDLIGLAEGLSFAGLSIADSALGAVISSENETLAIVTGTPAVDLTAEDFVAVPF